MARSMSEAFDKWMEDYTNHPKEYSQMFELVIAFLKDKRTVKRHLTELRARRS